MKKIIIVAATVAAFSVLTGSVMAAEKVDKATASCQKLAKKHHITEDKMESYMKSCVEKKSHKKAAAKPTSAPAPAAPAEAPAEAPAAQ